MRRRTAATCIAILAGLAGLLQYTLLQMAIVSDLHRSRQCTHLNFLESMYSTKKFAQTHVNTIAICNRICPVPCNASVNSKCALPPPRADPREFAFFFLWMANSRGRGHLSCQMPGGRDESRRQMPRYT